MKRFTNKNIQKERKKMIRTTMIGIILILIAIGFRYWSESEIEKTDQNIQDLNSIILEKNTTKENRKAYLNVQSKPYKFAVYDDTTDSYYIVSDGQYMYIVYMSVSDYYKLNKNDIYEKSIKIEGLTKTTTMDVKKLAIEVYNEDLEDPSEQLSLADFENYFGSVYLDLTATTSEVATIPLLLFIVFWMTGIILFLTGIIQIWRLSRQIRKLDDIKVQELDQEMNDENAFYYEKTHLYLTKHYIINFNGKLRIIRYEDILWMYPFEQRTNGVKTSQSIKIFTNTGKTYMLATINMITKQKKEIFNEIWNTIAKKNDKMLLGYTSENIKAMNQKAKEIKKEKKKQKKEKKNNF